MKKIMLTSFILFIMFAGLGMAETAWLTDYEKAKAQAT